jgi:hypothetical protein
MSSERQMWATLRQKMGRRWFAERIENRLGKGTPDVAFSICGAHGWLELKHLHAWPPEGHVVKIPHYTPEQKLWLRACGKGCWLLLKVGKEWILFDHAQAQLVGSITREAMMVSMRMYWSPSIIPEELTSILSGQAGQSAAR